MYALEFALSTHAPNLTIGHFVWCFLISFGFLLFTPTTRNVSKRNELSNGKDFKFFNPSMRLRGAIYIRNIPDGVIPLKSMIWQWLCLISSTLQLISLPWLIILERGFVLEASFIVFIMAFFAHMVGMALHFLYSLVCLFFGRHDDTFPSGQSLIGHKKPRNRRRRKW